MVSEKNFIDKEDAIKLFDKVAIESKEKGLICNQAYDGLINYSFSIDD